MGTGARVQVHEHRCMGTGAWVQVHGYRCRAVQVPCRAVPWVVGALLPLDVEAAASKGLLAVANDIHSRPAGTGRRRAER